jgi:dephospho-CoA kinase
MLRLKKVAVTGGIASGKSTVCQFFRECGAYTVDADGIVHQLLSSDTNLIQQLIQTFGADIAPDGQIDRKKLAQVVFKDPKSLAHLEQLLHPAVLREVNRRYGIAVAEKAPLFVAEIPLLYEIGADAFFDTVVAVVADTQLAEARFCALGHDIDSFARRLARQLPPAAKAAKADYTIYNNGTLAELRKQVQTLFSTLQTLE